MVVIPPGGGEREAVVAHAGLGRNFGEVLPAFVAVQSIELPRLNEHRRAGVGPHKDVKRFQQICGNAVTAERVALDIDAARLGHRPALRINS